MSEDALLTVIAPEKQVGHCYIVDHPIGSIIANAQSSTGCASDLLREASKSMTSTLLQASLHGKCSTGEASEIL